MPGPLPKPAHLRQRANRSVSRRELEVEDDQRLQYMALPSDVPMDDDWHPLTRDWWGRLWDSPQIGEFLQADLGALVRLAYLIDQFWRTGKISLAREIRVLEREFGLTPLSRRRLEWTVTQVKDSSIKVADRIAKRLPREDPRGFLDDVSLADEDEEDD